MTSNQRTLTLAAIASLIAVYATWLGFGGSALFMILTPLVAISALLTVIATRRSNGILHRAVPAGLLALMAVVVASSLIGHNLLAFEAYHDWRYALFLTLALVITVGGILAGWFVARWIAIGLAAAGILSAGLNMIPHVLTPGAISWTLAIHIAGALLVIANLDAAGVRERFERTASPIWTSSDPALRSIRWAIMGFFAAIPMLLVYAWMQPIAAATAGPAIALAAFLSLSIALAVRRKLIGAIGLVVGGLALLVLTGATARDAYAISQLSGRISLYYAAFWIPAGALALHCGLRLARPLFSMLRSSD